MAYRWKNDLTRSDITPKAAFMNRRQIMAGMAGMGALAAGGIAGPAFASLGAKPSQYSTDEEPNKLEDITSYNNFYEFGTGKGDPVANAHRLTTDPLVDHDRRPRRQPRRIFHGRHHGRGRAGRTHLPLSAVSRPGRWLCPGPGSNWRIF